MKRILAAALVAFVLSVLAPAQTPTPEQPKTPQEQAKAELNAGAQAYRNGNFAEAQQHFERALELDPENKQARLYVARTVQQQFRAGDTSPENLSKGEEAVAAFTRVLELDPDNDDAFNSVASIYRQMRAEDREREWIMQRATSSSASPYKRASAYVALSVKEWQCSRDITERRENRVSTKGRGPTAFVYVKPKNPEEFDRARDCATRGLQYADEAVGLAPDHAQAWAAKNSLLREMAKLAQMENDEARKSSYEQQAAAAADEQRRAAVAEQRRAAEEEERRRQEERQKATEGAAGGVEATREGAAAERVQQQQRNTITGGVLNSKAISKPQPDYPQIARDARAQGRVVVQILVDEDGLVVNASAVSGHPLLQAAAVEAAKQARFTPTLLSGRPVKVAGIVTYDFVLE